MLGNLKNNLQFSKKRVAVFGLMAAVIGVIVIFATHAATEVVIGSVEAESLALSSGATVVADAAASAGSAVKLEGNSSITTSSKINTTLPISRIVLRARGDQCKGSPNFALKVDGSQVATGSVGSSAWADYSKGVTVAAGNHDISVSFTNPRSRGGCTRRLYVDKLTLYGLQPDSLDTQAPGISWTGPAAGASLGGTVTLNASATDNVGVTKVEFLVDSKIVGSSTTSPYSVSWDTTTVTNGSHNLSARAYDAAGNTSSTANVSVSVSNSTASTGGIWAWDALSATVDPNSSAFVSTLVSYALVNPNFALNSWAVALQDAKDGDPSYTVPLTSGGKIDSTIRIPLNTKPDPSGDGHLTIRDVALGREHDFWQAKYDSTTGRISSASAGISFPLGAVNEQTTGWGGNAANFPLRRGIITPEEIKAGVINHPLVFAMPQIGSGSPRYPAIHNAATCGSTCSNHMVEGTWVRLDPSLNVTTLGLSSWQVTIAKAMQKYGMFLRDNSGSFVVYGENPVNRGGASLWSNVGLSGNSVMFSGSFPWNRLQVLNAPAK